MHSDKNKTTWDPFIGSIQTTILKERPSKLQKKLDRYLKNPNIPFRNLLLLATPGVISLGLVIFGTTVLTQNLNVEPQLGIFAVFIIFMPVFFYYGYIHNLQRDLVKLLVSQKKNWLYNPHASNERWRLALKKFPNFFNKGNQGQRLEDEFWGTFEETKFYQGLFRYQRKTGSGKNRRVQTYHKTIFAIELPKEVKGDFRLMPPGITNHFNWFKKSQTISTESHEFNKYFQVLYNGKADAQALNIVRTLSPALLEKLIHLRQNEGRAHLYFKDKTVLFMLEGRLLPRMKTNFFKKVELDPRDETFIEDRIEKLLKISQEMIKYLD